MTGLTELLSRFIDNSGFDTLPAEAARIVKTGFIDNVATIIAGRNEPVVGIVRQFVAARKSGAREPDAYHVKGWHPTGVLGTIGATAAVAHLHRLLPDESRNALALAASMSSGLVANFGTMTKPFHAGRAVACAIEALRLTVGGLTAAPDSIEHHAGYLAALSPQGQADRTSPASTLGRHLRILDSGLSIKSYLMCYATHRVINGVLDLAAAHDLKSGDVSEVRACVGVTQASMLRNHAPVTGLEAKFSLEFAVAAALYARLSAIDELERVCDLVPANHRS